MSTFMPKDLVNYAIRHRIGLRAIVADGRRYFQVGNDGRYWTSATAARHAIRYQAGLLNITR